MARHTKCNNQIDYSVVPGERILPFVVSLNLDESVLYPNEGEYQKFCYDMIGTGQDTSQYADLSHFLLEICGNITEEEIAEITVSINGDPQTIIWGDNVEIKTLEKPDNPTGCAGLKFDFPLNKVLGIMKVCIRLRTPYPIGPVNVCLYGGGTTATGLEICGPACNGNASCDTTFYQKETVCVPVKVTPFAKPGVAKAICCGEPVIRPGGECTGNQTACTFTITQNLCIEIPISFGADIKTGTAVVRCGDVSETECDCSDEGTEKNSGASRNEELRERRFFTK